MAQAFKCDRCDTFFESPEDTESRVGLRIGNFTTWGFRAIDLCPLCQAKFEAWFETVKKLKEEENG